MKKLNDNLAQKALTLIYFLACAIPAMAADAVPAPAPLPFWSNPVFIVLTLVAFALAFVIYLLGKLLTSVLTRYIKGEPGKAIIPVMLIGIFFANRVSAQPLVETTGMSSDTLALYMLSTLIVVELFAVLLMAYGVLRLIKPAAEAVTELETPKKSLLEKLNASVAIEDERDIMLDHDYDGIRELDNNLPPWWKYGFYLTIVFAVVYLVHYHVSGSGKLQLAEYEEQLQTASVEMAAYKKKAANLVDESNVVALTEPSSLSNGRSLFTTHCSPCHGAAGEGTVGPNLTDAYWLHGGSIQDVFKSIKYGWPQKGMKAWEKDLGAKQIQELSSFIKTLQGTNPPNGKEKQGEIYEETSVAVDSAAQVNALQITVN